MVFPAYGTGTKPGFSTSHEKPFGIFLVDNVPASKDVVSCGSGFDRLVADRKDAIAPDCEKVIVVHGSIDEVFEQEGEFFGSLPPAVSEFWDTFFDRLAADPVDNS